MRLQFIQIKKEALYLSERRIDAVCTQTSAKRKKGFKILWVREKVVKRSQAPREFIPGGRVKIEKFLAVGINQFRYIFLAAQRED